MMPGMSEPQPTEPIEPAAEAAASLMIELEAIQAHLTQIRELHQTAAGGGKLRYHTYVLLSVAADALWVIEQSLRDTTH